MSFKKYLRNENGFKNLNDFFSFQKSSNVNAVIFSLVVGAEKEFWYSRNIVNTVRQIKTGSSSISIDDRLTFGITGSIFWVFSLQGHRFQASPIQLNTPNPALVDGSRTKIERKKNRHKTHQQRSTHRQQEFYHWDNNEMTKVQVESSFPNRFFAVARAVLTTGVASSRRKHIKNVTASKCSLILSKWRSPNKSE